MINEKNILKNKILNFIQLEENKISYSLIFLKFIFKKNLFENFNLF